MLLIIPAAEKMHKMKKILVTSLCAAMLAGGCFQTAQAQPAQVLVLYAFTNADGMNPYADLCAGQDGNFYGTTVGGGTNGGFGTVFKVTTNGLLTSLVSFAGTNGSFSHSELAQGNDGNFYGTTAGGGDNGYGTVFVVTTNGLLTSLVPFADTNGAFPYSSLTMGNDGNFYGTTYYGGSNNILGTIFRVTTNGVLTSLASFNNTNGANPIAGLTLGSDGNFYGTTVNGGSSNLGTAFQITTNGVLNSLVSFNNTNGANPHAGWTPGSDGNFYGTTANGGGATTNGTVVKLIVPPVPGPVSFSNQIPQVAINGLARPSIQIQVATDLTASWSVLTNLVFTNGTGLAIDPAATNAPQRFYRAVVQ